METGFFCLRYEEKIDDALEATILPYGRSAEIFLHGYCDIFALALHQAFGYKMEQMADSAEPDTLVHAYCVSHNAAGNKVFIDVRGVTGSEGALFGPFEDFFTEPVRKTILSEHDARRCMLYPTQMLKRLLREAKRIIEQNHGIYNVAHL